MPDFIYTPDQQIEIHRENAIKQMCTPFLSHENGLPEWIKNSAAAYLRENQAFHERIILVFFCQRYASNPGSIAVMDFVGMTSTDIDQNFRVWADPDAAIRSSRSKISLGELGGHGNGGKCYMTQMFNDYSTLYTVRNGIKCEYGVGEKSVNFGYVPNPEQGKGIKVKNKNEEIEKCLKKVKARFNQLPTELQSIITNANGFTFVRGVNPKGYDRSIPIQDLLENLIGHTQMISPMQNCRIIVLNNGHLYRKGEELTLREIKSLEGFEEPKIISIPEILVDPNSNQDVSSTNNGQLPIGELKIRTSDKNMRIGRGSSRQARHQVTFRTEKSGFIGYIPMTNLDVISSYRDHMYCECYLESLVPYQRNERSQLAESPLTRATEKWISEKVEEYCQEFENRDRRIHSQQDKNEASRINEWLDKWKNKFMQEFMKGLYGGGIGIAERPSQVLPSGTPARIELSLSHIRAGLGVFFRPTLKFYDVSNKEIRSIPYRWISEDTNVAMVDEELMRVNTFSYGNTEVYAQTLDGRLCSNKVPLDVVRILRVRVVPNEIEMPAGTRRSFEAICELPNGEETSDVYLTWLEGNDSIARVSSSGLVYALAPGETEVTATDDNCKSDSPSKIVVVPGEGKGAGDKKGRGFPKILLSEINRAPGEDEAPVFRSDIPPVYQRPQDVDNNIWWINMASPFARLYYDESEGYGVRSPAWRMYHVERLVDIMVQIALTHGPDSEEQLSGNDWIWKASENEAEIREKAIESLAGFIQTGEAEY